MGELSTDALAREAWEHAAHGGQRPRSDDWRTWVFLGGRGAGKTRAGAEWVWETAQALGPGGRIALVGPTMHDARTVMVEGPSGLLRLPFRAGARFTPSLRRVAFPGGAVGLLFSAEEPERLRGPQFHAAWGDEFCAWARGEEVLAMLRLGLRLGEASLLGRANSCGTAVRRLRLLDPTRPGAFSAARAASDRAASGSAPKLVLTSTPRPGPVLRGVLGEAGCVRTDAPTRADAANLAPGFLAAMEGLYGGTRRAAQELEGRVLETDGALFAHAEIARAKRLFEVRYRPSGYLSAAGDGDRGSSSAKRDSPYDRVVVAVDPPAGTLSGRARDACGIVVVGRRGEAAVVLADWTARGLSPEGWADRVRRAVEAHGAHGVVVESNNGGAMAQAVLKASGLSVPIRRVHASLGKVARAEPVAALYEQGRVAHAPGLAALEEELMGLGAEGARASPDRADALVWAVTELMPGLRPGAADRGPWMRVL